MAAWTEIEDARTNYDTYAIEVPGGLVVQTIFVDDGTIGVSMAAVFVPVNTQANAAAWITSNAA